MISVGVRYLPNPCWLSYPQRLFFIREVKTTDDPAAGPLQLADRPQLPPARPPLSEDVNQWPMAAGGWAGVTQQLSFDEGA